MVPKTPIKERIGNFSVNDHQEVMSTQPKNYYQEYLSVKESLLSTNSIQGRRRNSFDHDRELGLEPHYLQFSTPMKKDNYQQLDPTGHNQKKSRSRSAEAIGAKAWYLSNLDKTMEV